MPALKAHGVIHALGFLDIPARTLLLDAPEYTHWVNQRPIQASQATPTQRCVWSPWEQALLAIGKSKWPQPASWRPTRHSHALSGIGPT